MRFRCQIGWHKWVRTGNRTRYCECCSLSQTLFFYSNRTQEWEDNETTRPEQTS